MTLVVDQHNKQMAEVVVRQVVEEETKNKVVKVVQVILHLITLYLDICLQVVQQHTLHQVQE